VFCPKNLCYHSCLQLQFVLQLGKMLALGSHVLPRLQQIFPQVQYEVNALGDCYRLPHCRHVDRVGDWLWGTAWQHIAPRRFLADGGNNKLSLKLHAQLPDQTYEPDMQTHHLQSHQTAICCKTESCDFGASVEMRQGGPGCELFVHPDASTERVQSWRANAQ
jgi:hypothetical protein